MLVHDSRRGGRGGEDRALIEIIKGSRSTGTLNLSGRQLSEVRVIKYKSRFLGSAHTDNIQDNYMMII